MSQSIPAKFCTACNKIIYRDYARNKRSSDNFDECNHVLTDVMANPERNEISGISKGGEDSEAPIARLTCKGWVPAGSGETKGSYSGRVNVYAIHPHYHIHYKPFFLDPHLRGNYIGIQEFKSAAECMAEIKPKAQSKGRQIVHICHDLHDGKDNCPASSYRPFPSGEAAKPIPGDYVNLYGDKEDLYSQEV